MSSWIKQKMRINEVERGNIDAQYFIQCTKGQSFYAHLVSFNNGILNQLVDVLPFKSDEILSAETTTIYLQETWPLHQGAKQDVSSVSFFQTEFSVRMATLRMQSDDSVPITWKPKRGMTHVSDTMSSKECSVPWNGVAKTHMASIMGMVIGMKSVTYHRCRNGMLWNPMRPMDKCSTESSPTSWTRNTWSGDLASIPFCPAINPQGEPIIEVTSLIFNSPPYAKYHNNLWQYWAESCTLVNLRKGKLETE